MIISLSIAALLFTAGVALCIVAIVQFARADLTSDAEQRALRETSWWMASDRHRPMPPSAELTQDGRRRRRHAFRCLVVAALCFLWALLMLGFGH